MLNFGEFARLGQVSPRMLRHHNEINLLKPVRVDPSTAHRHYDVAQLGRLHRLWRWPLRSSHGRDQLRISAMHSHARTSAKIDATLSYVAVFFVLFVSPEIARRSSQKKF